MIISFVLVEPALPENVGAAARAIKTMGFNELLLINPCNHLSGPARGLAHGSGEIPENAEVFSNLQDAVAGFDFVIDSTAKSRSVKYDYHPLTRLPEIIKSKGNSIKKVAIVFGREESGLSNEEMKLCHLVTTVPMKTTFPSLNLAQAVMLYAWELSKIEEKSPTSLPHPNEESFNSVYQKVEVLLKEAGFNEHSAIYPRFLERISLLKEGGIHMLHSYCNKLLSEKK